MTSRAATALTSEQYELNSIKLQNIAFRNLKDFSFNPV
jgi:hypothetical protein